jgi:hypothetical protein
MEQIEHRMVHKFARSLRRHQDQLLTFLDWAAGMLTPFYHMLEAHLLTQRGGNTLSAPSLVFGVCVKR